MKIEHPKILKAKLRKEKTVDLLAKHKQQIWCYTVS